ncbi:hypothetical protein CKR_2532 [Clostridium kluyveri NBRC 12016]|nr:hypothetical protein CKR_2532 [Clostridium kluyveri NBRC 12016]
MREVFIMARNNNNLVVSEARAVLYKFKMESAKEDEVNLKDSYNGNLTAREDGAVERNMAKKMVKA